MDLKDPTKLITLKLFILKIEWFACLFQRILLLGLDLAYDQRFMYLHNITQKILVYKS